MKNNYTEEQKEKVCDLVYSALLNKNALINMQRYKIILEI